MDRSASHEGMSCHRCQAHNAAGSRFCGACGMRLAPDAEPAVAPAVAEFKQATVLFADVVSSTSLVSAMDAEEAMQLLAPVVEAMEQVVLRFGGTIARTLGDGLMAVFGAPQAHEGHALLACQTALEMHVAVSRRAGIQLRIGLHSGEVVFDELTGNSGHDRRLHGVAIHLASRVVAMARPGQTYITSDCHALAGARFETEDAGAWPAKGFDVPVHVHRLLGARPEAGAYGRRITALRGRASELAHLQHALSEARRGMHRVVGLVGAPGSGKSRLCHEFALSCRNRQIPVLMARAQLYGHATPLQPVLEFLRSQVFHISQGDAAATVRMRITHFVHSMGEEFHQDCTLLCEFLGVAQSGVPPSSLSAPARRARLFAVVGHIVRRLAAVPSAIVIEDLHWLDAASADFLSVLVDALRESPSLLVVNYRPGYSAPWMKATAFAEIALRDLGEDSMIALVEDLVGAGSELHDVVLRIAQRSGGNPFFAEELVRSLSAGGTLVGPTTRRMLGEKAPLAPLPATVQAVIGARIDQLSESRKALLQLCAIVGKDVPVMILEQVMRVERSALDHPLDDLCACDFLVADARADGRWYSFRHPLIQEVGYRTQLRLRRAQLHAQVAAAMAAVHAHGGDEHAGLIAYHYEAAGQALDAARYAARAAAWISGTDRSQAIRHWRSVRQLMQDQPNSVENDILRSRASTQIAWLGWREGATVEQAKPLIDEALAWTRQSDPKMVPLLLIVEGRIHLASGGAADYYVERLRQAIEMLAHRPDAGRLATLNAALCHALGWAGWLDEALAANSAALGGIADVEQADQQFLGFSVEHWCMNLRGRILMRKLRFEEAQACFDRMMAMTHRDLDPTVRFIAHMGSLEIASAQAQHARARQHALHVEQIADRHPSAYLRVFAWAAQGIAADACGNFDEALAAYTESLKLLRGSRAAMEYESELLASMAECQLKMDQRALAFETATQALAVARFQTARLPQCRAYLTFAALAMRAERPDLEAFASLLAQAEQWIERTGASIYRAPLLALRAQRAGLSGSTAA